MTQFLSRFPFYGFIGLLIILLSEIGLVFQLWFFEIYLTPLCWSGLILFLDALNFHISGSSLIRTRTKEFLWMLPCSIALWYFFEFYNLFIHNWHYVGLPESKLLRYSGYFWSFATIWPGVIEIFELIRNLHIVKAVHVKPINLTKTFLFTSFAFGTFCMILPLVVPTYVAAFLAAPIWLGVIFILDPVNCVNNRYSLWEDLGQGQLTTLIQLFLTGFLAGIIWEFWNYWATAKWIYTVPILGEMKLFEMPVIGYLGFLPFAVEVVVMWETVKIILRLK